MRRVVILVVLGALGLWLVAPYVSALAMVIDLSGQDVALRRWLPVTPQAVTTRDVRVPTRHGPVDARVYVPAAPDGRTWLVIPGLHDGGVDEPRLARLTHRLAGEGIRVISLPLPDLREFRVVPRATDQIEDAALWALATRELTPNGTLGLVGVSFGGGLALVAAGRPTIADRIDRVISFGGHGDLPRVIEYLCTGVMPDGTALPAHDYGLAILLLGALNDLVPAEQVAPLDEGIRAFLAASMAAGRKLPEAAGLLEQAHAIEQAQAEPARSIMRDVNARDAARIGPLLRPLAESVGGAPALSPERSPVPQAQVFLIHGATDNVIPPSETSSLLRFYSDGGVRVHALMTTAVSHADPAVGVSVVDVWHLLRMWIRITS
jgi:dienelactone hydrolase